MATIRVSCPDCGDTEITTADMVVLVCAEDNAGSYRFRCPECGMTTVKGAEQRIVDLLVSSGVRLEVWRLPAEVREIRAKTGAKINHDDLLDFALLLYSKEVDDGGNDRFVREVAWLEVLISV